MLRREGSFRASAPVPIVMPIVLDEETRAPFRTNSMTMPVLPSLNYARRSVALNTHFLPQDTRARSRWSSRLETRSETLFSRTNFAPDSSRCTLNEREMERRRKRASFGSAVKPFRSTRRRVLSRRRRACPSLRAQRVRRVAPRCILSLALSLSLSLTRGRLLACWTTRGGVGG